MKNMTDDWYFILKINDRLIESGILPRQRKSNEVCSHQVVPGIYLIRREVRKGKEGKYGPGIYLEDTILVNKKMFENVSTTRGPLGWYIKQIKGKVYENDNVIVIIPADRESEEDKLQWAAEKLIIKDEWYKKVHGKGLEKILLEEYYNNSRMERLVKK
jgi:hypothetical protein